MFKFFGKIWQGLDGYKTKIGATLLVLALVLKRIVEIWSGTVDFPDFMDQILKTLEYLGGVLAGVGGVHKAVKEKK